MRNFKTEGELKKSNTIVDISDHKMALEGRLVNLRDFQRKIFIRLNL